MSIVDAVIWTKGALGSEEVVQLATLGLEVSVKLAARVYRVRGESAAGLPELSALPCVDRAEAYRTDAKLAGPLKALAQTTEREAAAVTATHGRAAAPKISVLVSFDRAADADQAVAAVADLGDVKQASSRRALVEVDPAALEAVARIPSVLSVDLEPVNEVKNNVARTLTEVSAVESDLGLDGSGEIVGVADSGLDAGVVGSILADFAGRVVNLRSVVDKSAFGVADGADLNNHGSHVSGSILSDGANSNGTVRGMASGARLTFLSMGPNNAYVDGARLHNNSWGSNTFGNYSAFSSDVDEFTRSNPDMLILLAAGNAGPDAGTVNPREPPRTA